MFKKWWFYVILAVVILLIVIPVSTISSLNKSVYDDLSFNKVSFDDPLTEIASKNTYYDAETKTLEIEINQDFLNTILNDELAKMDLGLPEKLTIQEAAFKTADQRIYINAKYGNINLPISAKINITPDAEGINISAEGLNLGKKPAPKMVTKQVPLDMLKYTVKYSDLGLPDVFTVSDIKFSTGNMNAFVELKVEAIKELALDYRDEAETAINGLKLTAGDSVATFVDRALEEGLLSDENVNKLVDGILDNEELVNSAVLFALAPDLEKYSKGIENIQKAVVDWAAPIQTLKFDGTTDEIVSSILYNDEFHDMLGWFIPANQLTEYVDIADTYYSVYRDAEGSLNALGASLESGDIEGAINQLVADQDLYKALTVVLPSESVDYYRSSISGYYNLYADVMKSLDEVLESIPDEEIQKYIDDATEFAYKIEDGQQFLLNILAGVDTKAIQEFIAYMDADMLRQQLTPAYYDAFMLYVDNLDVVKAQLIASVKSADVSIVKESADIINDINDDLFYVLDLLRDQKFEKAGDAMGKIRFNKAEDFIKRQTGTV